MANPIIRIKRSSVSGKIPTPDQLPLGEVALNTYDGYLYASKNVGVGTTVIAINPFRVGTGTDSYNAYFTAGNVGINTTNPTSRLSVVGDGNFTGNITATSYNGSGTNLTGIVTTITAGSGISIDQSTGNVTITATGGGGGDGAIGIRSDGILIGTGVTTVDFIGAGITVAIDGTTGLVSIPTTTRTVSSFTATNGQTEFTGLSYTVGYIDVYLNGARLDSTEYTASNGTSITLATGASTDDIVETITYDGISITQLSGLANVVDDTTPQLGGNLDLNSKDITGTGNANITGTVTATSFIGGGIDLAGLLKENVNVTAGKLSDNTNIDLINGMVHLFTTTETTTSTPNIRYDSSNSLDSKMNVGESIAATIITTAAAAGYSAQLTIDGSAVTESWLDGSVPTTGGASGYDVYTYNIIKTGSATFVVLANLTNFA